MKVFVRAGQGGEFVQAVLWMLGSGLFFSCLNAQIRYLTQTMHPLEITFFRNLFGLVFMLPWLFRSGLAGLRTGRLKLYFWRTAVGLSSMMMSFSALALLPLSLAVALSFTAPLFTTMGAALVLGEKVRIRRWSATILGFCGVLVIVRPGAASFNIGMLLMIGSAALNAATTLMVKHLSRTEPANAIVTYMVLLMTPMSLAPALFVWQTPPVSIWLFLVGMGFAGSLGHLCYVRALRGAEASAVLPYDYGRMIFSSLIGYFAFAEIPDRWTWIGSAIIAGSAIYIARRESQLAKRAKLSLSRAS
ncbi:MAG TPA: DMT family transporter [Dongiaceae bacterium]|nr:DMT family transporter [Dongiaceae bacterium]